MRYLLAAALLVVGCASTPSPTPSPAHTITGTFVLDNGETPDRSNGCAGTGGYKDITDGAQVVVKDDAGAIVATGRLVDASTPEGMLQHQCKYTFSVGAITDAPFYTVEVAHRGGLTYAASELEQDGWTVALTLGG